LAPALPITLYAVTRADEPPPHTLSDLLQVFSRRAQAQLDHLYPCGSGLARESGGSVSDDVD
jgi:hypothetical protein